MACERDTKVTIDENKKEGVRMEEVKIQEGVLVLKNMPEFKMEAYNAETGHYTEVSSE
ncbi:MAG TPA: peroxiredoxin, partial [Nautiliaceae bacterium]|nr:peroxiredoxin [Nautiliaceae bacterium]